MIAIDVELLTGRYVATHYNDRSRAEWPPHPARLYSALVAAWAQDGERNPDEAAALDWLAAAGPPEIVADAADAVSRRTVVEVYVPDVASSVIPRAHDALDEADRAAAELSRRLDAGELADASALKRARKYVHDRHSRAAETLAREIAPVVDAKDATIKSALALLPSSRGKQPRTFPSVTPERRRVTFVWPRAEPSADERGALQDLVMRVVRLGHSSSLVSCRLSEVAPDDKDGRDHWIPDDGGEARLRVVAVGQRERLQAAYARHREMEPRTLPYESQPYSTLARQRRSSPPASVFGGDWVVFRELPDASGRPVGLPLTRAADIARTLRNTLMRYADQPPAAVITGHAEDGQPLERPHLAFVSLADVATRWASGLILGVALVLPRSAAGEERRAVLRAIGRWEDAQASASLTLHLGRVGILGIKRVREDDPRSTLEPATWCGPARHWASVTPVALDQNPGNLGAQDPIVAARAAEAARGIVGRSCERIGLPAPVAVEVMRRSIFDGCAEARHFMPFPNKDSAVRRVCVHVEMIFQEPVQGPILLGAGRYQGLGLFRPVHPRNAESSR